MKILEAVKRWTGDGYGDSQARIFTQLKRTEKVALYKRTVESTGHDDGYEVFLIKMRHKGDKLPGGMVEEEDREVYPSAGSFGKSAWNPSSLREAEFRYNQLTGAAVPVVEEDEEETPVGEPVGETEPKHRGRPKAPPIVLQTIPDGEWSVKELAELNKVQYVTAYQFIKQNETLFVPTRTERRAAKGKETQLYKKA